MRLVVVTLLALVCLAVTGFALAAPMVSNVQFTQQVAPGGIGSQLVVEYDLAAPDGPVSVALEASSNGGQLFNLPVESVTGDVGQGITAGTGKQIVWALSDDLSPSMLQNAVVRVVADDTLCAGCQLWSDPTTWGGALPQAGDNVTVPAGTHVLLDQDTPVLSGLTINGTLEFARQDLNLSSDWIIVAGALRIGSRAEPFTHQANIILTGDDTAQDILGMGTRGLMVTAGELTLIGNPPTPWTKISDHIDAGQSTFSTLDAAGWSAGDEIAVAPTEFYGFGETEAYTIQSVNGTGIQVTAPFASSRWGRVQYPTASGMSLTEDPDFMPAILPTPEHLDQRAAVANLTRNIVIQAPDDALWQNEGFGAHVMVMDLASVVQIDGVEFRRGGQRGRLARYPFHAHMLSYDGFNHLGDVSDFYLRNSVINTSMNRGIVIHGTNGMLVQNNVVYDVLGHGVFTEDAVERRNIIDGNLVLHIRNPAFADALKDHELRVPPTGGSSGFWLSNPDNIVTNNYAADCEAFGFWLAYPTNPWGLNIGVPMIPNRIRFGVFDDNIAHSNRMQGVMFDNPEINNDGGVLPVQYWSTTTGQNIGWPFDELRRFSINRLAGWKNGEGLLWDRVVWPDLLEITAADNCGRAFAGSGADGIIEGCLIVGTSLNHFTDRPQLNQGLGRDETPTGFATYHSTFDMKNNVLVNLPLTPETRSGAFSTEDYYIRPVDKGHIRNVGNIMVNTHPGYRQVADFSYFTLAGALWDPHGIWGPAGNYFVYDLPFLTHGLEVTPVVGGAEAGGVSVPGKFYGVNDFVLEDSNPPWNDYMAIHVTRFDDTFTEIDTWTVTTAQPGWALDQMRHFAAHESGIFQLEFPDSPLPTDVGMTVENMHTTDDTLVLGVQFDGNQSITQVFFAAGQSWNNPGLTGAPQLDYKHIYSPVASRQAVIDSPGETYWQDTANNIVWVKLRGGVDLNLFQPETFGPFDDEILYHRLNLRIY